MTQLAEATRQKEAWARAVYINNDDAHDSGETEWWRQAATNAENAALREWDYWRAIERDCRLTEKEQAAKEDGEARALGTRTRCIIYNGHHTVGQHRPSVDVAVNSR